MHARTIGVVVSVVLVLLCVLVLVFVVLCFGAALALVIAAADADWIDLAPIGFDLGMDFGIAIHFRCAGLQNSGLHPLGQSQHVDRAMHAGLGGLDGIRL